MRRIGRKLCWNKGVTGSDGLWRVTGFWEFGMKKIRNFKKYIWLEKEPVTTRHNPSLESRTRHFFTDNDNMPQTSWVSDDTTMLTDEQWACLHRRSADMVAVAPYTCRVQPAFVGDDHSGRSVPSYTRYTWYSQLPFFCLSWHHSSSQSWWHHPRHRRLRLSSSMVLLLLNSITHGVAHHCCHSVPFLTHDVAESCWNLFGVAM